MDIVEFQRLNARVVATRNSETRAFLRAFDQAPGVLSGWSERTCANWRAWSRANDALRDAVSKTAGVPPSGFEPLISTLKGSCPRPLDDGGAARTGV